MVVAVFAGELPQPLATLHEKNRHGVKSMRQDVVNKEEETRERIDIGGDRNKVEMVADMQTPASNGGSPGARFGEENEGNGGGNCGVLIGQGTAVSNRLNRWIEEGSNGAA